MTYELKFSTQYNKYNYKIKDKKTTIRGREYIATYVEKHSVVKK